MMHRMVRQTSSFQSVGDKAEYRLRAAKQERAMGNQAKVGVTVLAVLASLLLARAPGLAQVRFQQRQRLRPLDYSRLAPMLGFEMRPRANIPGGWTGGRPDPFLRTARGCTARIGRRVSSGSQRPAKTTQR